MDVQVLKDRLTTILTRLDGVCLVYLFGSRVEGDLGPMSDYDLAVLVDRAVDGRRVQARLAHELARALQTDRIDLILLNRAPIDDRRVHRYRAALGRTERTLGQITAVQGQGPDRL
jgi:predicted nucleotidyltransferase